MYTIAETEQFRRDADAIWTTDERVDFCAWLAANPEAGDVIPGAEGCRKVRWSASGRGKRGGARVIYFNQLDDGLIVLLGIYTKARRSNLPARTIREAKHETEKHPR